MAHRSFPTKCAVSVTRSRSGWQEDRSSQVTRYEGLQFLGTIMISRRSPHSQDVSQDQDTASSDSNEVTSKAAQIEAEVNLDDET